MSHRNRVRLAALEQRLTPAPFEPQETIVTRSIIGMHDGRPVELGVIVERFLVSAPGESPTRTILRDTYHNSPTTLTQQENPA